MVRGDILYKFFNMWKRYWFCSILWNVESNFVSLICCIWKLNKLYYV